MKESEHAQQLNALIQQLQYIKESIILGEGLHNAVCCLCEPAAAEGVCEGCLLLKQEVWRREYEKM